MFRVTFLADDPAERERLATGLRTLSMGGVSGTASGRTFGGGVSSRLWTLLRLGMAIARSVVERTTVMMVGNT